MWNFVDLIFIHFILTIVLLATLINVSEAYLPAIILQTFRYGKHAYNGIPSKLVSQCEIPKSYFKHFYVFAIVWSLMVFGLATIVYVGQWPAAQWMILCLDALCGYNRIVSTAPLPTYVAITLLTLQCVKRFYETHWVQVFSSHSKMNISHYAVGYFHYFGAFLVIVGQAPGFVREVIGNKHSTELALDQLTAVHYMAIGIFLYSLCQQHQCNLILANLRKNKSGTVVNYKHLIPTGQYFELVSAPHMFFEILMYIALQLLLLGNTSWIYVVLWVGSNQVENAWLTHKWYLETFDHYDKLNRRAIIPYLL